MAIAPAVGDGPIEFVGSDGLQLTIPLTAITFVDGVVTSSIAADGLDAWLKYLVAQGQLVAGPTPTAPDAMVFKAVTEGATGNDITVTVKAVGASAVELIVKERHVYKGLNFKPAADSEQSLEKLLDAASGALVQVDTFTGGATAPVKGLVVSPQAGQPPWAIKDAAGATLATLAPRTSDWDDGTLTVFLDDIDDDADPITFTLTMEWVSKSIIVDKDDLTGGPLALGDLEFVVSIDPATKLPKPGAFTLHGGADAVSKAAETATATLPANE